MNRKTFPASGFTPYAEIFKIMAEKKDNEHIIPYARPYNENHAIDYFYPKNPEFHI